MRVVSIIAMIILIIISLVVILRFFVHHASPVLPEPPDQHLPSGVPGIGQPGATMPATARKLP